MENTYLNLLNSEVGKALKKVTHPEETPMKFLFERVEDCSHVNINNGRKGIFIIPNDDDPGNSDSQEDAYTRENNQCVIKCFIIKDHLLKFVFPVYSLSSNDINELFTFIHDKGKRIWLSHDTFNIIKRYKDFYCLYVDCLWHAIEIYFTEIEFKTFVASLILLSEKLLHGNNIDVFDTSILFKE